MSERLALDFFCMAYQIMNPMSTYKPQSMNMQNFKTWKQLTNCAFAKPPPPAPLCLIHTGKASSNSLKH